MAIIGFTGRMSTGKNLSAKIWRLIDMYYNTEIQPKISLNKWIKKKLDSGYYYLGISHWEEKSYAHKLKQIVSILTGCSISDLDDQEFKKKVLPGDWAVITYRQALQYIGTDLFREKFHPDTWVFALMSDYKPQSVIGVTDEVNGGWVQKYPNWLITDVRFPNEAKAIKDRGGKIIRLFRN
jgi:hypothetical protein